MPRSKPPYPREFREEAVRLVRSSGRPIAQIARELGIAHGTLSAWVKQAELDAGLRSDGLVTAEREELRRLRRENRILREEREIRTLPMKSVGLHGGPWGKRPPSSLGRPSPSRRGVWLRGAGEGSSSGGPDVPGAGRLPQRVLRVAQAWAESQAAGGCGAAGTGSEDLGGERPDVWGTPGVGGAAGRWGAVQPQAPERG
jgi:transposase